MARIDTILNTSSPVAALSSTVMIPEVVSMAEQKKLQQLGNQLNNELARYDQLSSEKRRAEFMSAEAKYNKNLNFGRLIGGLATGVSQAMEGIYKVQDKRNELLLKDQEDIYLIESNVILQEDYLNFRQQNPTAHPNEVNAFLLEKQKSILEGAPSEASRIDAFKQTSSFRMSSMTKVFNEYNKQQRGEVVNQANVSIGALVNQAYSNPEGLETYLEQASSVYGPVQNVTNSEEVATQVLNNGKSKITASAIKGKASNGEVAEAGALLTDPELNKNMSDEDFGGAAITVIESDKRDTEQTLNSMSELVLLKQAQLGISPISKKHQDNLSNTVFDRMMGAFVDQSGKPIEGVSLEDLQQLSVTLYTKYDQLPIGSTHRTILEGGVKSGSPEVAVANAMTVSALSNNPDTAARAGAIDSDTVAEASKILRLKRFGYSDKEAVELTRKDRVVDPNVSKINQDAIKAKLTDFDMNEFVSDIFDEAEGWEYSLSEGKQMFNDIINKYPDMDTAKEVFKLRMQYRYPVSKINGRKQIMPNAPELYYNKSDLKLFKRELHNLTDKITEGLGLTAKKKQARTLSSAEIQTGIIQGPTSEIVSYFDEPTIEYKDSEGIKRRINVGVAPIDGITENGTSTNRQYMLVNKDTNQPILKSEISGSSVAQPIVFNFSLTETPEFQERAKKNKELYDSFKQARDLRNQQNQELRRKIEDVAAERKLSKEDIDDLKRETARVLGVYDKYEDRIDYKEVMKKLFKTVVNMPK